MAASVTRFSVILLAFALFQTISAASLKTLEDDSKNWISSEEDLNSELNVFDVDPESVRQARQTGVIFRPLFATRERDAQRQESRRRTDEAKREREHRKAAQREIKRRAAAAAAIAVHRNHAQPAPVYIYG